MGGIIGMLLAAEANSPIRRLVVNDVGPFIPLLALKRIGAYVGETPEFANIKELEKHIRQIYGSFGDLGDEVWAHLAEHSARKLPNGRLALAHDPAIARAFLALEDNVDFWASFLSVSAARPAFARPKSDILSSEVAQEMTWRGPKARFVEFPKTGHAPALTDPTQIAIIRGFSAFVMNLLPACGPPSLKLRRVWTASSAEARRA